jgi:hypothetical protein
VVFAHIRLPRVCPPWVPVALSSALAVVEALDEPTNDLAYSAVCSARVVALLSRVWSPTVSLLAARGGREQGQHDVPEGGEEINHPKERGDPPFPTFPETLDSPLMGSGEVECGSLSLS